MVSTDIKKAQLFKEKIRQWEPKKCNCKICLSYIQTI